MLNRANTYCLIILSAMMMPAIVFGASIAIDWHENTEPDLAGYNVYYGTASRSYGNPIPVGKATQHEISDLKENVTYFIAVAAVDTSGNESGYSGEEMATPRSNPGAPAGNDAIDLSSKKARKKAYGNIPEKDQSHIERVKYVFSGRKGKFKLKYHVYDVTYEDEVKILLNGQDIGYAPLTKKNKWTKNKKTAILQDTLVHDDRDNIVEFVNTYNPTAGLRWGVKKVRVRKK